MHNFIYTQTLCVKYQSSTCKNVIEKLQAKLCPQTASWTDTRVDRHGDSSIPPLHFAVGGITSNQHFLLFQQCFLPKSIEDKFNHLSYLCHMPILSIWSGLKICRFVKIFLLVNTSKINSSPNNKILDWSQNKSTCRRQNECG